MEAMRRGDLTTAWAIADAIMLGRDPADCDNHARPYHERWVWSGWDLHDRHVVVRCYHGLGDTLQFARFLPALRERAAHVTLEVQPELLPLLARAADRVIPFDPAAPVPATHAIEIMELQHALRAEPPPVPYLAVPATPISGASVGACWQAGSWDSARSVPLPLLRPVLPPGTVSLQRGASGLPDPLAGDMDLAATAGLIASLDIVVTVDTMVAHLAGALGRPTHLLLKADADWRWGQDKRTCWYSAARIYRQGSPGDWTVPLANLAAALKGAG